MLHTITLGEIAAELRMSKQAAMARLRPMMKAGRFPQPLPDLGDLWSRHLVAMWFRTNGGLVTHTPIAANDGAPEDPVAAHRAHLNQRYGIDP
jgi:hypothetical protein